MALPEPVKIISGKFMKLLFRLVIIGFFCGICAAQPNTAKTEWQIEPSLKYDALCFLNVLTNDSFYRNFYAEEYARFEPRLSPEARASLANLKRKLKDENKNIVSAFLSLYFSATDAETLDEMSAALDDSGKIKANLQKTVYYNKDGWKLFESVRKDLRVVLKFLKDEQFDVYWRQQILPKIEKKAAIIDKYLSGYDVIPEIEKHLGSNLASKKITVYALYFSRPHGMKLTGTRFITDISYPPDAVLRIAIHELLHPPFDLSKDSELKKALDALRRDEFLTDKIRNHNPSFGYNSFESYTEENCVRALDQIIGERLGIENDARRRWKDEDDGMHVLAAALYYLMKQEKYDGRRENFRAFLLRILREQKLSAGKIKLLYDEFYLSAP
jgi:hypothetical protein